MDVQTLEKFAEWFAENGYLWEFDDGIWYHITEEKELTTAEFIKEYLDRDKT